MDKVITQLRWITAILYAIYLMSTCAAADTNRTARILERMCNLQHPGECNK